MQQDMVDDPRRDTSSSLALHIKLMRLVGASASGSATWSMKLTAPPHFHVYGICAIVVSNSRWCLSALPLHAMPTACSSRWLCDPSAAIGKAKGASSRAKMPWPLAVPTA